MRLHQRFSKLTTLLCRFAGVFVLAGAPLLMVGGCDRKEKIIDVETPIGDVEVHGDTDEESDGSTEVDVQVGAEKE